MKKKKTDSKKKSYTKKSEKDLKESVASFTSARSQFTHFVPRIEDFESINSGAELVAHICGSPDFQHVEMVRQGSLSVSPKFVEDHQSPVCRIQWKDELDYDNPGDVPGRGWGTGTMISDALMLTCAHVFDQTGGGWSRPLMNGTFNIISPYDIARSMEVNFNYQLDSKGNLRQAQSFPITELVEYRRGGLDMAICRIGGNPGRSYGKAVVSTNDAVSQEILCIIGHPAGGEKLVDAGSTAKVSGDTITYSDIDTLGGSSGSGILRARDGQLVGIHTKSGCSIASPFDGNANSGLRITSVINVSPTLRSMLGLPTI